MELTFSSTKRQELIDITSDIERIISESGVKEGICNIFVPHATAAVTLNENADPNVMLDVIDALNELVPAGKWRHDKIDGNADAHIKAAIVGASETVPIRKGKLMLGTWQDIMLCCFDGPRKRKVIITIISGTD